MDSIINKLQEMGLNKMESEVYHLLLQTEPMTAYKIGKLLNKPTANIYKAVDSLSKMGAVLIESGDKNMCRAVEPNEFLNSLQFQFRQKAETVSAALSNLQIKKKEEGTYTLESLALIFEKAKSMIDNANVVITLGVFPETFKNIEANVVRVIKRGVKVNLLTYGKIELKGANITTLPIKNSIIITWKGQQLNLVVDGQESLISSFDLKVGQIFHASWSTNIYLSCVLHRLFLFEHTINEIMCVEDSTRKLDEIEDVLKKQEFFHNSEVPGFEYLMKK